MRINYEPRSTHMDLISLLGRSPADPALKELFHSTGPGAVIGEHENLGADPEDYGFIGNADDGGSRAVIR